MMDIKDLLKDQLQKELVSLNIEKFRAGQILDWVYKKYIYDFDKMTNLPPVLRTALREEYYISDLELAKELVSNDGARKFLFKLEDGKRIESVFIPSKNTNTVCCSSQVGCKFACKFCASGNGGFVRNLRPAEMVNQVLYVKRNFSVTNVVFMGMGEPLDNYENVLKAVRQLNAPYGLNIGQRKITISTCGIVPGIKRLSKENLQIELSVSIHAPDDKTRLAIMGINKKYPVKELLVACREYIKETNRQITFEYILIKGVNDSRDNAQTLAKLLKGMIAKVNLIPFNAPHPTPSPQRGEGPRLRREAGRGEGEQKYSAPDPKTVKAFKDILDKNGIASVIRVTRGADIAAACGQLKA